MAGMMLAVASMVGLTGAITNEAQKKGAKQDTFVMKTHGDVSTTKNGDTKTIRIRRPPRDDIAAKEVPKRIEGILKEFESDSEPDLYEVVDRIQNQCPSFNFVICQKDHDSEYNWDGIQGEDWDHEDHGFGAPGDQLQQFDIYWAKSGWFTMKDEISHHHRVKHNNWDWVGNAVSDSEEGKHIVFEDPL